LYLHKTTSARVRKVSAKTEIKALDEIRVQQSGGRKDRRCSSNQTTAAGWLTPRHRAASLWGSQDQGRMRPFTL